MAQPLGVHPGEAVALGAVLVRAAAPALGEHAVQLTLSAHAQQIESFIETGNVLLLFGELDLTGCRRSIIVASNGILRAIAAGCYDKPSP